MNDSYRACPAGHTHPNIFSKRPFRAFRLPIPVRGFTLLELTVVIVVIGILAAIAIPTFLNNRDKAHDAVAVSALRNVASEGRSEAVNPDGNTELVFPGPASGDLVLALVETDPTYTFANAEATDPVELSQGPNHIWVWRPNDQLAVYAALSDSGTCWYIYDFLVDQPALGFAAGLHLFADYDPPGPPPSCGRQINPEDLGDELTFVEGPDELPIPEGPPPPEMILASCGEFCHAGSFWGDPHVVTFDGLGYEFHTVGEYLAFRTKAGSAATPAEMHLRTGNELTVPRELSYTTGAALRFGSGASEHLVSIAIDDDYNNPDPDALRVDGNVVVLNSGEVFTLADGMVGGLDLTEGYVTRDGNTYYAAWPDPDQASSSVLTVAVYARHLNVNVTLTEDYTAGVEGLLGNADGDSSSGEGDAWSGAHDDLLLGDGVDDFLPFPTSNHSLHTGFADLWSIDQTSSLFEANGVPHTPRDPAFPARFVDNDTPVDDFAEFDAAEVAAAIAGCEADEVHPNLLQNCALDVLVFGAAREAEARWGALNAAVPNLINIYDNWEELLTFNDGATLPAARGPGQSFGVNPATLTQWTYLVTPSDSPAQSVTNMAYRLSAQGEDKRFGRVTRYGVVPTEGDFTFQADVHVPGMPNLGHLMETFGMLVTDGTTMFQVKFGPTWIQDGNDMGNPDKVFVTNLESRWAQVRIVKRDDTAFLYVDGNELYELTAAAPEASPWDFNQATFGNLTDSPNGTYGAVAFDNVGWTTATAHSDLNMLNWGPDPWAHLLHFNDDALPTSHSWGNIKTNLGSHSSAVVNDQLEVSKWVGNARCHLYRLPNTVSTNFTLQVDLGAAGASAAGLNGNALGVRIADGTRMFEVYAHPTRLVDGGDSSKAYFTNLMSRNAQVRIVKTGATANLYVDGNLAFALTPIEGTDRPCYSSASAGNAIELGIISDTGFQGLGRFDNLYFAGEIFTPAEVPMDSYSGSWVYNFDASDLELPSLDGWVTTGSPSIVDGVSGKALQMTGTGRYQLPDAVPVGEATFEIKARVLMPAATQNIALEIADGSDLYSVRLHPLHVQDAHTGTIYPVDLTSRHAEIRVVKTALGAQLWIDGVNAGALTSAPTAANYFQFGALANLGGGVALQVSEARLALSDMGGVGATPYAGEWMQSLDFEDNLLPSDGTNYWIRYGKFSNDKMSIVAGPDGNRVRISDPGGNNAAAYRRDGLVGTNYRFQADVQVESQSGGDDLAIAIDDGSARVRVNLYTDKITDPVSGATHNVDLTEVLTITVTKTALGGSVAIDGSTVLSLESAASISNSVHFGSLDTQQVSPYNAGNNTAAVAFFDNVRLSNRVD